MKTIEAHELEERISEVLRQVREDGESIEITNSGEAIAHLVPVYRPQPKSPQEAQAFLDDLDRLAEEIGKHWPEGVSAVDAVRDVRYEL